MTLLPKDNKLVVQDEKTGGNPLFPVFLKLNALHTVLIGGGNVGLEKLTALLQNSPEATVTIIAQNILPEVHVLAADYAGVNILQKSFADTDLDHADVVIAATNDSELNKSIREAAHSRKLLINVADQPGLCDFYLGSIVKKGDLKIAISTNGKSPTFAKRFREVLEETLPENLPELLNNLKWVRDSLSGDFKDKVDKLYELTSVLKNKKEPLPTIHNERDYRSGTKKAV